MCLELYWEMDMEEWGLALSEYRPLGYLVNQHLCGQLLMGQGQEQRGH